MTRARRRNRPDGPFRGGPAGGRIHPPTALIPLQKQMWGDEYGQLVDRFGIIWHVNIAGDAA